MTATYRHESIRDKALQPFRDAIGHTCFCGVKIVKKNLAYYRDEHGELKPICRTCGEFLKDHLPIIFPVPESKVRRHKIEL